MGGVFDSSVAFVPFYDEVIVVEGKRPFRSDGGTVASRVMKGTFRACIFDEGFADPLSPNDADSSARYFSVSVKPGDWRDATPPQVGDRISFERESITFNLRVKDIVPTFGSWTVTAREVKNG